MFNIGGSWPVQMQGHGQQAHAQPMLASFGRELTPCEMMYLQQQQYQFELHRQQHQAQQYNISTQLHTTSLSAHGQYNSYQSQNFTRQAAPTNTILPHKQGTTLEEDIDDNGLEQISPPATKRKRRSTGDVMAQVRDAAAQLFRIPIVTSIKAFCESNSYNRSIEKYLNQFIASDSRLKSIINQIKQLAEEAAEIIRDSPYLNSDKPPPLPLTDHVGPNSPYWYSTNAIELFGVSSPEGEENDDVREVIQKRMRRMRAAWVHQPGSEWKGVVHGDDDMKKLCTHREVWWVTVKCRYLYTAYSIALEEMPRLTWDECCKEAILRVNAALDFEPVICSQTVRDWHTKFRRQGEFFANPAIARECGKPTLPRFFQHNPEAADKIKSHSKEHLAELSGEFLHSYIHNALLPETAKRRTEEMRDMERKKGVMSTDEIDNIEITVDDILTESGLTTLDLNTVYRWMLALGFKYETRTKHFYVDCHEKPEVVYYRDKVWIPRYLKLELRCHRWIPIPATEADELIEKGELGPEQGYRYTDEDGIDMVEYHVDDHDSFLERGGLLHPFGGLLSVRKPSNELPVIILGQDEAIWKQYLSFWKAWTHSDGTKAIMPKDDGQGVMISAVVSRDLGYGVEWTPELRARVNQYRRGKYYSDQESAITVTGSALKKDLMTNPCVEEFEYGAHNEGYWSYPHMVTQLEDCADVMKVKMQDWGQDYEIVFMLDHSQNHNKLRPDWLNAKAMRFGFGGSQPEMHDTTLEHEGCLGPYPNTIEEFYGAKLSSRDENDPYLEYIIASGSYDDREPLDETKLVPGSTHRNVYSASDPGPFYFSAEKREETRKDRPTGKFKTDDKSCSELLSELQAKGIRQTGTKKKLQELARAAGIDVKKRYEIIEPGWEGKAKGLLQTAFERGFIDPDKFDPNHYNNSRKKYYSVDGKKDSSGNIIPGTSLREIIEKLPDFVGEETLIQYHAKCFGTSVMLSPKAHPETAGEGIEYDWAFLKIKYRRHPLEEKRSKEKFRDLVRKCMSRESITVLHRRKFARRARQYIIAYHALDQQRTLARESPESPDAPEMSASLIEKVVKRYKTHRNILDQEKGFVTQIVDFMRKKVN